MKIELKPCPFCGGEARFYYCDAKGRFASRDSSVAFIGGLPLDHKRIVCEKCGVRTKQYKTDKGVWNAWNRRADNA